MVILTGPFAFVFRYLFFLNIRNNRVFLLSLAFLKVTHIDVENLKRVLHNNKNAKHKVLKILAKNVSPIRN